VDLEKWIQAGEQVIVMLNANGDAQDGAVQQMFSDMAMREVLLELHSDLPATSTFSRNFQEQTLFCRFPLFSRVRVINY
jgi:hypothetical protein